MSNQFPTGLAEIIDLCAQEFMTSTDGFSSFKKNDANNANHGQVMQVAVAAVLGYSGDQIKGSLVLTSEKDLLLKTHPNLAMGMPVGDPDTLDWLGEMSNQILGRIKNRLSAVGVKFSMSTPTTVSGKSMQVNCPKDGHVLYREYLGEFGKLTLHFLTVVEPGLKIEGVGAANVAPEGDSILF